MDDAHDVLVDCSNHLCVRADAILRSGISSSFNDDFALMLVSFSVKQLEHFRGVGHLVQAGCFSQAGVLARCMLEGFGLLYWVEKDRSRARLWRAHCFVHDLRLFRRREASGEVFSAEFQEQLLEGLRAHAVDFLKKSSHKANPSDQVLLNPDCYRADWIIGSHGKPLGIAAAISEVDVDLRRLYSEFSKDVHWSVSGHGPGLSPTPTGYEVRAQPAHALSAMTLAFQSCVQTFLLLADYFKRPDDVEYLVRLRDDCVSNLKTARQSSGP